MAAWCREHGVGLLTYGTVLGGLLSEKYLGRAEPGRGELNTASLRKYKQMIDAWGGWALFQELLAAVARIAGKHRVGLAAVAIRFILDRPAVAGRHCRHEARGLPSTSPRTTVLSMSRSTPRTRRRSRLSSRKDAT